ncbi:hypothetical protein [Gynuella sunshinyii]|uniref:Uncharacterized protein n=1 Tax=Gynuella sunshinyii YC6258 TaxID=1445510 RepID=A0A0C5VVG3_9GAMM|nr:hypothetical protein [Gynuella sunshinyii]AJQ97258.1 hypothetical Protein YC6258_05228 [Gynuella sunshinyii YC6258]
MTLNEGADEDVAMLTGLIAMVDFIQHVIDLAVVTGNFRAGNCTCQRSPGFF